MSTAAPTTTTRVAVVAALASLLAAACVTTAPPAAAAEEFRLSGRGNGHGIGMSQYGALGQSLAGHGAEHILSTYYRDTGLASRNAPYPARVGVVLDTLRTQVVARGGQASVTVDGTTVTSGAGEVWDVRPLASGRCRVTRPDGSKVPEFTPSDDRCLTADPAAGARVEVRRPDGDAMVQHHQYGRSSTVEVIRDDIGETWRLDVVVTTPLEEYLLGLAEVPYSWGMAALKAQAIAGRSYALHRLLAVDDPTPDRGCSCHLFDSQQDQVWKGWDREQSDGWSRWERAVTETAGAIVHAPGEIGTIDGVVQAFYSSSSNGRTEAKHELWGGDVFPYLVSIDDPWSRGEHNPWRSWQASVGASLIAERLGIDRVDSVDVTARSTSGAATRLVFRGTLDGTATELARTGSWTRTALGLRSTTIEDVYAPPFTDDDGNIHEAAIAWLANEGITAGCNPPDNDEFCPDDSVTRGQMAAFLTRALDLPPGDGRFTDTDGSIFAEDIASLAEAGITRGCNPPENTRYCPDNAVTRAQMASFLDRALGLPDGETGRFVDVPAGHVHEETIAALAEAGITRGCNPPANDRYCPDDAITRAQMATFLNRGLTQ